MIVRNLLTNTTVTAGGTMIIGGIGSGVYRPVRLEEVTNVTSITLSYYRNGTSVSQSGVIVPYENAIVNLSAMSPAAKSVIELTKDITTGVDAIDTLSMVYVESGTSKTITLRVLNVPVANPFIDTSTGTSDLTDYRDGRFNQLDFRVTKASPLTGAPFNHKIFYQQTGTVGNSTCGERLATGGTKVSFTPNGWSRNVLNPANRVVINTTAEEGIIGYIRYAKKYPYCPDVTKRVTLKWLNSKGLYDTMNFVSFKVQPTYTGITGGNRILSYGVTVNTVVTYDNEKALYWLSRSADVQGVFPIDTNQWARVTITNPNAFNTQGGELGRSVSYKCKFEIIEP